MDALACASGVDLMLKWGKIAVSAIAMAGVAWFVFLRSDFSFSLETFAKISHTYLILAFITTIIAALIASLRLFITARIFGYRISFPQSVAALSLGQIGGALFFQLAGQLMARSAWLSRFQVPVSGTLVITGYERLSALVASLMMAGGGALYLFGGLTFQSSNASTDPIRLVVGLILAAAFGAWFAWGRLAWTEIRQIKPKHIVQFAINVIASLVAQSATMAVYVMLAKALNPSLNFFALIAASTLVMFAASIPISFAGWGVRELSAVAALGFIGLSADAAFVVAVMVGAMSLLAVALLSLTALWPARASLPELIEQPHRIDYSTFINTFIAIAAPTAILFQIFLPASGREINVNLADPIALLGGALFVAHCLAGQYPQWKLDRLLLHLAACTAVLALSYVIGLLSFGWSDWAFTNKFLGWFVLLAYAATGALIAHQVKEGHALLVATMVATSSACPSLT
ncbi:MAG: lysylphosphatidylglycerol synthase transmembrane domain-containing protein, partial [Pseudolabrys sp.]